MKTPNNHKSAASNYGGATAGEEEILISDKQKNDMMNAAINIALEFDMAFKLMSYRVATREMFLERCESLSRFFISEVERIRQLPQDGKS